MKHITRLSFAQLRPWHGLVLASMLTLALLGQVPDSEAGWLTCPPWPPCLPAAELSRKRQRSGPSLPERLQGLWRYLAQSWPQPVLRSLFLALLWSHSDHQGPVLLLGWPWLLWLWQAAAAGWPGLGRQPLWSRGRWLLWQGDRVLLLGYLLLALSHAPSSPSKEQMFSPCRCLLLGLGCQHCGQERPWVDVARQEDGSYLVTMCGHFTLHVAGDETLRKRWLMLFLRQLHVPGQQRGSRRTRDGRTPFVRQQQLSAWFDLPQPDISRIEGYWQRGAWPELLGQGTPELLTPELIRRVVTVCATFPHWSQEAVYCYLQGQGLAISQRQVRQAWEQSGWSLLRQELQRRYHWTPERFHLQETWLVQELLQQVRRLQECLETDQPLAAEEQVALADLQALLAEVRIEPRPSWKALPWLLQVQRVVFGDWQAVKDDTIRCPDCGSTHIVRKSGKPRLKRFYDAQGALQAVPVYRYYCRNPECARGSFTHLPPDMVPYSRHRREVHLLAWQAYAWSYSTYRRVGQALQVSETTIYRWVSAWGHELLPVAALFGLVRSSGVVGVDEKFVLVPKNDKPPGPMRRWMYVYLAVDVHTYDLLHIAIYPHNTHHSAHAFLLAVRSKGYQPRVIVTDLRRDYGPLIAQVFPQAEHHECLFHAEQEISRYLRETLGRDYAQQHPEAEQLRQAMVEIFQVRTKRTAHKRYQALLDRRAEYVQQQAALQWVFDFLEQHWPYLVNAVENDLIPATNNATEMVIRRFDQHYQNFCGFESIQSAQLYLGVFEKLYRFTPFSADAQPQVRGKSPLQLAGYDLSQMPMDWLCRGYGLERPVSLQAAHVPNL
jgi:transposase-like protein